jgi:hypothetical protein
MFLLNNYMKKLKKKKIFHAVFDKNIFLICYLLSK